MKTIEEIKIELTLKKLSGSVILYSDIAFLPIDDSLRTFVCSLGHYCAYVYASAVDERPLDETRTAACKSSTCAFLYARYVDRCPREDTRESAYKKLDLKKKYQEEVENIHMPVSWKALGDLYY